MDLEDPGKDVELSKGTRRFLGIPWLDKCYDKLWNGKRAGVLCMAVSSAAYSVMGLLVKLLTGRSVPSSEIVMARCGVISVLAGIGLRRMKYPCLGSPKARKLVIIRSLLGFVALSTYFYSIQLLPLRDATMLNFTMPVFTAVLATCFLNEKWGCGEMMDLTSTYLGDKAIPCYSIFLVFTDDNNVGNVCWKYHLIHLEFKENHGIWKLTISFEKRGKVSEQTSESTSGIVQGAIFADIGTDLGSGCSVPGDPAGARRKRGTGFGYGAGIRLDSSIGPLRIDYAVNDMHEKFVYIGIGYHE